MVRRKVGNPDRRRSKTVSPDSEEATDVSTFAEAVVYLTNDRRFELVPLLGDGRNHGLISLLKREKITHLTVRLDCQREYAAASDNATATGVAARRHGKNSTGKCI